MTLAGAYLAVVSLAVAHGHASVANAVGNTVSIFGFALFAFVLARYLRHTSDELDAALQRALAAEADRACQQDRIVQYRRLHDTVLATLTALARSGLDPRSAQLRRR